MVRIYTRAWCGYCTAALRFFHERGISFEEIDCTNKPELRRWLVQATGRTTVPQIFINDRPIGGYSDLVALDDRGVLATLLEPQGSSVSG